MQGLSTKDPAFGYCSLQTSNNADYPVLAHNQHFVDKVIRTAENVPGIPENHWPSCSPRSSS